MGKAWAENDRFHEIPCLIVWFSHMCKILVDSVLWTLVLTKAQTQDPLFAFRISQIRSFGDFPSELQQAVWKQHRIHKSCCHLNIHLSVEHICFNHDLKHYKIINTLWNQGHAFSPSPWYDNIPPYKLPSAQFTLNDAGRGKTTSKSSSFLMFWSLRIHNEIIYDIKWRESWHEVNKVQARCM